MRHVASRDAGVGSRARAMDAERADGCADARWARADASSAREDVGGGRGVTARPVAIVRRVDRARAAAVGDDGGRADADVRSTRDGCVGERGVGVSAEAREAAYRLARERIFGDGDGEDADASGRFGDDRAMSEGVGCGGGETSGGGRMSATAEPFAPSKAVKKGSWRDRKDPEEYRRGTRHVGTGVFLPRSQQYAVPPYAVPPYAAPPYAVPPYAAPPYAAPPYAAPQFRAPPPLVATAPPVPKGPPPPNQLIRPPSR